MKEITVPAVLEELDRVLEFVNGELIACGCPVKTQMQLDIAVEELYVNIARYAYHPEIGNATVRCTCLLYTSPSGRRTEALFTLTRANLPRWTARFIIQAS